MPANIGKMFYYGDIPWHRQGIQVVEPLTVSEALKQGGLEWEVDTINLATGEYPPSPVKNRIAIVRKDKAPGDPDRVLGVAHRGFKPLQNREGARIFDAIFGKNEKVYHTGGYLKTGEVVWLLAKLPKKIKVADSDEVKPYALFTNSHDGSIAIDFRLTTVRVVCQNTLSLALADNQMRTFFKHAHQGNFDRVEKAAKDFFDKIMGVVDTLESSFKAMLETHFPKIAAEEYIFDLFPLPNRPSGHKDDSPVMKSYHTRLNKIKQGRRQILELTVHGKGTEIKGVKDSLWGTFNAVLEFLDHYQNNGKSSLTLGLFDERTNLKKKAFRLAMQKMPVQTDLFQ